MESLIRRRPIWIGWLLKECCSPISTQPILSAHRVSALYKGLKLLHQFLTDREIFGDFFSVLEGNFLEELDFITFRSKFFPL